jgi:hypothetical protein
MPADFADEAQEINETFLELSLKKVPRTAPPLSGFCLHCEEPVTQRRYCDSTCREGHEASQRHTARFAP